MNTDLKKRKQLTHITLRDGRVLISQATPEEINNFLANNSHIMIEWEWHSKYDIVSFVPAKINDLESYILSQTKEFQDKIRAKKQRLKKEMGKEMSIEYAQNYVENHCR